MGGIVGGEARVMKVAIVGAGMTGAYLFRLLNDNGHEVHIFDRKEQGTSCGLTPCAWGTSADFIGHVGKAGLDAGQYILRRFDHVWMDDVRISADLITFDKPRLVRDLLQGAAIRFAPLPTRSFDRVIDATGVARALLPAIADDIIMECRQYLVETDEPLESRIRLGGIGYAWCFPLAGNLYHIGCGSLLADPQRILEQLGWLESNPPRHGKKVLCGCAGKIRLTGPHQSQPFVTGGCGEGIWGVGEAIGCVAPLVGDGIVPGMRSVQLLLDAWNDSRQYREAVLDEFSWMKGERGVVDSLRRAEGVGLREALVLRKNSRRMGMRVGIREAIELLKNLA
jgi:flavin-dependent dehydrogenase